ncbi:RNA polymerase, sigma-24 subunit, RpoE, ECF subfamily [Colwellia psychrerythraea]|uniref:RNA polymerase, sigma-24 subunit, RpoE, ECF subfamily n=1 Tax=Colwellia psychrerythraea TaxID=28229 RepID=A0A099KXD1_COLPS|nr:RNA polymerase, sigma-24 subunit, RpoE, ECF subfamily [Colwellia psychrerythraea]
MDSQTKQDKQVIDIKARLSANKVVHSGESDDESLWIIEAKQGSQTAFYQLYEKYHRRIYALCWRMLADKDSAEDVCQEVFVVLWQKINNFRGESKFSTWLYSVATNVVLGHLRKHKNWLQRVFSIEEQGANVAEPHVGLTDDSMLTMLDQHIACLPERARLVFVLFAVEGYRHEEIAAMLKMAVGSSKSQYHRAKSLLKESLIANGFVSIEEEINHE